MKRKTMGSSFARRAIRRFGRQRGWLRRISLRRASLSRRKSRPTDGESGNPANVGLSSRASGAYRIRRFLSLVFFFSGLSALIYQVMWQRFLATYYGVGPVSIALIVSVLSLSS
jgi:hypothetical protein